MHTMNRLAGLAVIATSLYAPPVPQALSLMPWPKQVTIQPGALVITGDFSVSVSGPGAEDVRVLNAIPRFVSRLSRQTGIPIPNTRPVAPGKAVFDVVVTDKGPGGPQRLGDDERYSLTIAGNGAKLTAEGPLGVLRGIETALQLVQQTQSMPGKPAGFNLPNVVIRDEPRFPWRGLSFDVSRHFMPVDVVKRTLDGLAAVKLNVLHWHLSDDEGFRVESKKFPKLQELGSDGMYYTQAEIRELVAYAADRGIRIVPEFDMPGHSTSWLAAYPELGSGPGPFQIIHDHRDEPTSVMDPTKESTYEFLDAFIEEMVGLFPDEYFHVGGDEVSPKKWLNSPHIRAFMDEHKMANAGALQAYFSKRILDMVTKRGRHMVGWDEILNPQLPKTAIIHSWRGQKSLWSAAKDGYQGLLSAGYYLDLCYPASYHYAIDPMKAPASPEGGPVGNGPAPGTRSDLTPEQAKLILGGEAATWEELASVEIIDSRLWPRLAAIAERFWSPESTTDVASMYRRLKVTGEWLEWLGSKHRTDPSLMRRRLAGPYPQQPLDILATLVEPTKGYSRHAQNYGIFSSLNRLSFAIPSESDEAREFRDSVTEYLAIPAAKRNSNDLRTRLSFWSQAAKDVRPMLQNQSVLTENLPVANGVETLCQVGQEALLYLQEPAGMPVDWKKNAKVRIDPFVNKRFGDLLIQIAPGIQKLVEAVPAK
jgi:hexosaminidase